MSLRTIRVLVVVLRLSQCSTWPDHPSRCGDVMIIDRAIKANLPVAATTAVTSYEITRRSGAFDASESLLRNHKLRSIITCPSRSDSLVLPRLRLGPALAASGAVGSQTVYVVIAYVISSLV